MFQSNALTKTFFANVFLEKTATLLKTVFFPAGQFTQSSKNSTLNTV